MDRQFDRHFFGIKEKLLLMANQAEVAVALAVKALVERDDALASQVKADDELLDRLEIELDELCLNTRCLHLMSISKCLERIADHAKNVAEDLVFLCEGHDIRHTESSLLPATAAH